MGVHQEIVQVHEEEVENNPLNKSIVSDPTHSIMGVILSTPPY